MIYLRQVAAILLAHTLFILLAGAETGGRCGLDAPDPAKTCVSIRLPWDLQPMYFCVDKGKFKYRNQCQSRHSSHCWTDGQEHTLLVATPWECCPLTSNPDSCANQHCPPSPHNRTCKAIAPDPNQPWECCGSFFCEADASPETCHFKRLEPQCNKPPTGKENCVAFIDTYGCCPKYQCAGEGRPGMCPAESEAKKFMARINDTSEGTEGGPEKAPGTQPDSPMALGGKGGGAAAMSKFGILPIYPSLGNQIACIGDFNCPGTMKCCSHDTNVYISDNKYVLRNKNPTNGYCTEPASNSTDTQILKRKGNLGTLGK